MKKLLTILLSVTMVLCMMPSMAFAGNEVTDPAAKIGDNEYATLQEAVNAGGEITLLKDITEDISIDTGKNVVIDLNGNKITNKGSHTILNKGNLTIKGNGVIDNVTHTKGAVYNDVNGVVNLEGGTYMRSAENSTKTQDNKGANGGNSWYVICNLGTMNINSGSFKFSDNNAGYYSSLIENGWQYPEKNTTKQFAKLTINGGDFVGGKITLKNDDYGVMNIHGGTFTQNTEPYYLMLNWNEATITDGTFNGIIGTTGYTTEDSYETGKLLISGGSFNGFFDKATDEGNICSIGISGGTYSVAPTEYVDESYKVTSSNGTYTVIPKATKITMPETLTLTEDSTSTITATVEPASAGNPTWTSSNTDVATVDENGMVTAKAVGIATITATIDDLTATCIVTVKAKSTGGGSVTPSVPSDPITNTGTSDTDNATTNADISKDTTSKTETVTETKPDGTTSTTTTTTVSKETADKIVDKAVEHQSAEVVVDTTISAAAPAAGDKTEVKLPAETMQTLAEKTTADVTIKSDVAEVTLDAKAVDAVAEQAAEAKTETVTLVVENTKNDADEMHFELNLVTESGKVTDFKGGTAKVTVKLNPAMNAVAKLVCVYIDENGVYHKVEGAKNADGTFTFVTGHFSTYAIMAEDEADKVIEEQTNARIIAGVQNTTIKATSEAGKGYIRVKWNKSKGYKVDYFEVYKAKSKTALKASKKPYFETKSGTWKSYKNTKALKKGTRYYYRVRGVREINGQTYYTNFSTIAYRIAK